MSQPNNQPSPYSQVESRQSASEVAEEERDALRHLVQVRPKLLALIAVVPELERAVERLGGEANEILITIQLAVTDLLRAAGDTSEDPLFRYRDKAREIMTRAVAAEVTQQLAVQESSVVVGSDQPDTVVFGGDL